MKTLVNVARAILRVKKSSGDVEKLDALNALTEEFYRTIAIVLYARYLALHREKLVPFSTELHDVVRTRFRQPNYESWVQFGRLCADELHDLGDTFVTNYSMVVNAQLSPAQAQSLRQVKQLLSRWEPHGAIPSDLPPTIPDLMHVLISIVDISRIKPLSPITPGEIIKTGVSLAACEVIEHVIGSMNVEMIVPISFDRTKTRILRLLVNGATEEHLPPTSEYQRYLYTCYVQFVDEEPFRYPTGLLHYNQNTREYYLYSQADLEGIAYKSCDASLRVQSYRREKSSIEDVFDIPAAGTVSSTDYSVLERRFGSFWISNDIVHNVDPRLKEYIRRPIAEKVLKSKLAQRRFYITTLDGGGGFGKTELTRAVIWDIIESQRDMLPPQLRFSCIMWFTGQKEYLSDEEIQTKRVSLRTVNDVMDCILYLTNNLGSIDKPPNIKRKLVIEALNQQESSLIVLDNLETVAEREVIWDYLIDLIDSVSSELRVLTTSRIRRGAAEYVVTIGPMLESEARVLVEYWMTQLGFPRDSQREQTVARIVEATGSIPLLIRHFVHLLRDRKDSDTLFEMLPAETSLALDFAFGLQWNGLSDDARKLLVGIGYHRSSLSFSEAKILCSLSEDAFTKAMNELNDSSFLIGRGLERQRLEILPPIATFADSKLGENRSLEHEFLENESLLTTPVLPERARWGAATSDDASLNQLLQRAELEAEQGAVYIAYSRLRQATERFPQNALAWRKLGEFEYRVLRDFKSGRASMKQATLVSPTDMITYESWAVLEYDIGVQRQDTVLLKRSIRYYEQARQLSSSDIDRLRLDVLMSNSHVKVGEVLLEFSMRARENRQHLTTEAETSFIRAIDILERISKAEPKTSTERFLCAQAYALLSRCFFSFESGPEWSRESLDDCAIHYLASGLKIDTTTPLIREVLKDHRLLSALRRHGRRVQGNNQEGQAIRAVLSMEMQVKDARTKIGGTLLRKRTRRGRTPREKGSGTTTNHEREGNE